MSSEQDTSLQQDTHAQWQPDITLLCNAVLARRTACICTSSASALDEAMWSLQT